MLICCLMCNIFSYFVSCGFMLLIVSLLCTSLTILCNPIHQFQVSFSESPCLCSHYGRNSQYFLLKVSDLGLIVRFTIYLQLNFVQNGRKGASSISRPVDIQFFQHYQLKGLHFLHFVFEAYCKNLGGHKLQVSFNVLYSSSSIFLFRFCASTMLVSLVWFCSII